MPGGPVRRRNFERAGRVEVEQRAGQLVDAPAVQARHVDRAAVGELDRLAGVLGVDRRQRGGRGGGEVAVGGDVVDLLQGSVECAHGACPF